MMKKSVLILCVNVLLVVCSCDNSHYFFRENVSVTNEIWAVQDKIPFRFTVSDTLKNYTVGFNIRYTNAYPKQNLYVFLHTVFPDGLRANDTLSIDLFSADGTPIGKGNRVIELQQSFSQVRFPMAGQYFMILEQAMRTDSLSGIVSMGLYIVEPENVPPYCGSSLQ